MISDTNNSNLASLVECASRLRVPAKWLKDRAKDGDVPCLRIGRRRTLFNVAAVERALAEMAEGGQ